MPVLISGKKGSGTSSGSDGRESSAKGRERRSGSRTTPECFLELLKDGVISSSASLLLPQRFSNARNNIVTRLGYFKKLR